MVDHTAQKTGNTIRIEDTEGMLRANVPLHVVDLGGGTIIVTEMTPQVPALAESFREEMKRSGLTLDTLLQGLDEVKNEMAEERLKELP